jgi:2-oxoisovalerate dehydrogenase E1 component
MDFSSQLSNKVQLSLYKSLITPRLIEEKMLIYLRQGKISKWFSGIGQEAISVGCTLAMDEDEFILPMHRNLGVFTARNVEFEQLFLQFQGKEGGFTKGRDRSFHFGSKAHNIVGMISHLGPQLGIADGIALGNLLKRNNKTTLVFSGDGGASEGDFHEALNVAAVWKLPVIFVIENNQWGLSTPSNQQFACKQFIDKGIGYGMEAVQLDGNNIIEVYEGIAKVKAKIAENPQPYIVECMTFRRRGHEEASGTKYYPEGLIEQWEVKDPVSNYERYLLDNNIIDTETIEAWKESITKEVSLSFKNATAAPKIIPNTEIELGDIFMDYTPEIIEPKGVTTEMRLIDAIHNAMKLAMERHESLILMGQDIADYGGVFKATEGFLEQFGEERVRNTPLCESAIVGAALGLCMNGYKAMMEMQFSDFVTVGFNQIINNLAKIHYRWGQNADVVVRMPTGAGVAAGPFHSQSIEGWFFHTPGLKIVYPSSPREAKGLLLASFEDPNPVLFFEHKALYRSINEEVEEDYFTIEIGKANVVKKGTEISIITYGLGVHWARDLQENNPNISIEIVDLRTLSPLDTEAIYNSVNGTGKVIVLHEANTTGGVGAEIATLINENCFENLDAPVRRIGSLDTPVPFAADLEQNFLPIQKLQETLIDLYTY